MYDVHIKAGVINIDLMVPNVLCTHVSCTPSACLPITIVSSLNTQAASRLFTNKTYISNITYVWIYLMVSEVVGICLNIVWTTLTHFGEIYGFCEFLTILTEDLKIEEVQKDTKVIKTDIFQGFICYNPVRSAGLAKLRRELTDKWF